MEIKQVTGLIDLIQTEFDRIAKKDGLNINQTYLSMRQRTVYVWQSHDKQNYEFSLFYQNNCFNQAQRGIIQTHYTFDGSFLPLNAASFLPLSVVSYKILSNLIQQTTIKNNFYIKHSARLINILPYIMLRFLQKVFKQCNNYIINSMNQDNQQRAFTEYDEDGDKIINPGELTLLEKTYLQQAKKDHRENMTKTQKLGTKIFKGAAFIGKPQKIEFRDFDVGKAHTLVLTLTNVSNAFNSFNVLPLPQKIRNYFEVSFTPKGKISPGITCDIKFKFLPQLNQDINSQFSILAETGQINFPIICTSKKAIVRCRQQPELNFYKVIEGQAGHAKLKIHNQGALRTQIIVKTEDGLQISKAGGLTKQLLNQLKFEPEFYVDGYSQKIVNFSFVPSQVGNFRTNIQLYCDNFLYSPPILVSVKGQCIKVPVTIEKPLYDFEICLLNHIYRQKLVIYNAGDMPMSFKVSQPQSTKKYFEFSPMIGYVQKQAKIDIWVKFIANKQLQVHLANYLKNDNIYIIPFQVEIKEQVLPVRFQIKFKITSDQVLISPSQLNFGSIFEGLSSKIQVLFQNQSELPQQIFLSSLKNNLLVQNQESLFKILPKSSVKKYIRYRTKPLQGNKKSNRQQGSIICKLITGDIATNQVKIDYNCQTVKPDLSILENHIDFQSIQIDQTCSTSTFFKNNTNKDIIFELFTPPFEVCGLKVTPVVKTLSPDQEVQINIQYHSFFKKLGANTLKDLEKKNQPEVTPPKQQQEQAKQKQKQTNKKDPKKQKKLTKAQQQALQAQQKRLEEQARLKKQREEAQRLQLQKNFDMDKQLAKIGGTFIDFGNAQHYKWVLPVYFKKKDYPDASAQVNFLEVTTTSTQKILISEQSSIDFGQIPVGTRKIKQFVVKSNDITQKEISMNQLPVFGGFSVLNSLKIQPSTNTFRAVIQFQPTQNQKFEQILVLSTDTSKISCVLRGVGARPDVDIVPKQGLISFGGVMLDEQSQRTLTVKNVCNFEVDFVLQKIDSGVENMNSARPFLYIPSCGKIPANGQIQIKIIFKPDRINENFYQKIKVNVPEQEKKKVKLLYVSGYCYPRQAYVKHYKQTKLPLNAQQVSKKSEYALDWMSVKDQTLYFGPNNKTIILEFKKTNGKDQAQPEQCFKRKLVVGSCKLLDNKLEKPTNFQFIMPKDDRFQCDNLKGTTAPGAETVVTFTYKPQPIDPLIAKIPVLLGVGQWKDIKIQLKLSGGFAKPGVTDLISFDVILRVYLSQI